MFFVSVIIPTYNRYKVLQRAINSVLTQTYKNFELIIVDDGSIDDTIKIQKDFPNIRYFYQENNGVSSARNLGIQKAKYEWIAFLDSDDEWMENKLELQVNFHLHNQNILMSYTQERWIRNDKIVIPPKKFQKYDKDIFLHSLSHCIIAPSATMIHKKLFENIGYFDEHLEVCEDYDLWLRISKEYTIGLIKQDLIIKYGGDADQLSMKYWGMDRFRVIALEKLISHKGKENEAVISTLLQKYKILLKGAIKYDRIAQVKAYKDKIIYYENLKVMGDV